MTAQRTDTIIINKKEYTLYSLPLDQYWNDFGHRVSLLGGSTALWRGYHATWMLEANQLFLTDFWGENFLMKKEYCLEDVFPNQQKVFADWYTGDLSIPFGKQINYFHGGLGGWTHEYNATIKIDNGVVIATDFKDS